MSLYPQSSLWAVRPRPQHGEAFSSWFYRLVMGNTVKLHTFTNVVYRGMQLWNRDLDAMADERFFETLQKGTGIDAEVLKSGTLLSFEGLLFETYSPIGNNDYILPLGLYHRTRRGFGSQFCPQCLASDRVPFARLNWRLATYTACHAHSLVLLDRCPKCFGPYIVHQGGFLFCYACKFDLRKSKQIQVSNRVSELLALLDTELTEETALSRILGSPHQLTTFSIIHWLLSMLSSGARAHALRLAVHRKFGGAAPQVLDFGGGLRVFEKLSVGTRHALMAQLSYLIGNWPDNFVESVRAADLWRSWLLREHKLAQVPYPIAKLMGTMIFPDTASITGQKKLRA
jgi:TniQ